MATQLHIETPRPAGPGALKPAQEDFERIECRDCGQSFPAPEGSALLFALKSSCPSCGGEFRLVL